MKKQTKCIEPFGRRFGVECDVTNTTNHQWYDPANTINLSTAAVEATDRLYLFSPNSNAPYETPAFTQFSSDHSPYSSINPYI